MTTNLLQKIEEKVMILLDELEHLRKEIGQLKQENTFLQAERNSHTKKLQGLISLLDILDPADNHMKVTSVESMQSREEFAV